MKNSVGLLVLGIAAQLVVFTLGDGYRYERPRYELTYPTTVVEERDETIICKERVDITTTERPEPPPPERIVERVPFIPEEHLKRDEEMRETIKEQKVTIGDQGKTIDNQDREIREQVEIITERTREIETRDRTIEDQKTRIADQKRTLDDQDRKITDQVEELRERRREIQDRDKTIGDQRNQIDDQIRTINNQEIEIREFRETIEERNRVIDERDKTIAEHLRTIDFLVEELNRLRGAPNLGVILGDKIIEFIEMEKQKVAKSGVEGGVEINQRRTQQRITTSTGGAIGASISPGTSTVRESSSRFSSSSRTSGSSGSGSGNLETENELNFNANGGIEFPSSSNRFSSRIPLISIGGNKKSTFKETSATNNIPSFTYGPPKSNTGAASTLSKTVTTFKESRSRSSGNSRVHRNIIGRPSRQIPTVLTHARQISRSNSRTERPTKLIRTNGYRSYLIVPSG